MAHSSLTFFCQRYRHLCGDIGGARPNTGRPEWVLLTSQSRYEFGHNKSYAKQASHTETGIVGGTLLKVFQDYVYLFHTIQLGRKNFDNEAESTIQLGCAALVDRLRRVFTSNISQCPKTKKSLRAMRPVCFWHTVPKHERRRRGLRVTQ